MDASEIIVMIWVGIVGFLLIYAAFRISSLTDEIEEKPNNNGTLSNGYNQITSREYIPKSVRREVFNRCKGKCVECGSHINLQYDHIIPVSKGGNSTSDNLQVLCRDCNLRKGAGF
jgi:hypothetical protein